MNSSKGEPGYVTNSPFFSAFWASSGWGIALLRESTSCHRPSRNPMSLFTAVEMAPRDPILGLTEQYNADTNPKKVNLGVGVYYDDNGKLPLLQCVQAAEKQMMADPKARGYLPIDGIAAYDA